MSDPQASPLLLGGRVLDTGAVMALCRGWLHMEVLTRIPGQVGIALVVPAGVLVEAGRRLGPDAGEVARFADLAPVVVARLDTREALRLATGDSRHDTAGAELINATRLHVLDLAERRGWSIITDDPAPYPDASVELIPRRSERAEGDGLRSKLARPERRRSLFWSRFAGVRQSA